MEELNELEDENDRIETITVETKEDDDGEDDGDDDNNNNNKTEFVEHRDESVELADEASRIERIEIGIQKRVRFCEYPQVHEITPPRDEQGEFIQLRPVEHRRKRHRNRYSRTKN